MARQRLKDGFHDVVRHANNFLDGFLPARTKVRNASLTDSEILNIFARSGESTTTLLPSAYLLAYFPRTPLLKSYSGSMSACLSRWMAFFINGSDNRLFCFLRQLKANKVICRAQIIFA